jgi:hypothetical protein
MPKRDDGNEVPQYRKPPAYGDASQQTNFPLVEPPEVVQGTLSEYEFFDLYNWCPSGLTSQSITGLLVKSLSLHFSSADFIHRAALKPYVWNADPALSKLRIVASTQFDPRSAGQLPALVVRRGAIQSNRMAIGDVVSLSKAGLYKYTRFAQGSHTISCLAETDGAAEQLAMEVFDVMTWLGPIYRVKLPFHDFQTLGMGELGLLDQLGNRVGVQISVSYAFEQSWETQETAEVFAKASLATSSSIP